MTTVPMIVIHCPGCGSCGRIEDSPGRAANDDEDFRDWTPPEGFRKVQFGPAVDCLLLFCVECGVAACRGPVPVP